MKKLFLILLLFFGFITPAFSEEKILNSEKGKILSIQYADIESIVKKDEQQVKQIATVEILSGSDKGKRVVLDNILTNNPYYDLFLKKGDNVILHVEEKNGENSYFIADMYRVKAVYFLVALFAVLLVFVASKKGLYSLISLSLTLILIFTMLIPMILKGVNPILAALVTGVVSSFVSIYMVAGFNYKSTAAILGTNITLLVASIVASLTIYFAKLTGFSSEEILFVYSAHPELNFVGILTASIIIATLGALMDTAISIASSVNEFFEINEEMSFKDLFKSGMNVGKDIIGTMANTLILVYMGSSLPLFLLSQNIDLQKFFNLNQVVTEISSALIGSIAIVVCVPITAVFAAYLIRLNKNEFDVIIEEE